MQEVPRAVEHRDDVTCFHRVDLVRGIGREYDGACSATRGNGELARLEATTHDAPDLLRPSSRGPYGSGGIAATRPWPARLGFLVSAMSTSRFNDNAPFAADHQMEFQALTRVIYEIPTTTNWRCRLPSSLAARLRCSLGLFSTSRVIRIFWVAARGLVSVVGCVFVRRLSCRHASPSHAGPSPRGNQTDE